MTTLHIADEVATALAENRPVVALESTILSHGLPAPRNLAVAARLEKVVREAGAVPATIAVLDGVPHIGLSSAQLDRVCTAGDLAKLSLRDLGAAYALGRRVVPVSPNTFYAYLRVIVMGLRGLRIERDAQEIQARLGRLRGDLEKFRDAFDVVGKHLSNARNKYDDAAAGLGRLEGKLEGIERHGEQEPLPGIGS